MDEILKLAPLEERIYRHRCVEAWSIVVPWIGFPSARSRSSSQPTPKAKFVAFESYYDLNQMPQGRQRGNRISLRRGLAPRRSHESADAAPVGMYGETLPNQDGAPVRMVIPWKYGFKSIKSIVQIACERSAAHHLEYRDSARIRILLQRESQRGPSRAGARPPSAASENLRRRPTLMFNGYGDQVASMYAGMDLKKYY